MVIPEFDDSPLIVPFNKVTMKFGWLGNMSPYPIQYGGYSWRTSEHLFQALRLREEGVVNRDGEAVSARELIRSKESPMMAKWAYRGITRDHPELIEVTPRSPEDLNLMRMVLRLKFDQHPRLVKALCQFHTDTVFIENVTSRPNKVSSEYWGARLIAEDRWRGHNWLGRLIAEARDELRQKMEANQSSQG